MSNGFNVPWGWDKGERPLYLSLAAPKANSFSLYFDS